MDLKCLVWIIGAAALLLWGTFKEPDTFIPHDKDE